MRSPASQLTQSRYYSPAFNAAIFDGPVRIYFAQYQEALALKIYFRLQDKVHGWTGLQPGRQRNPNVFIMLYPTEEIFANCFSPEQALEKVVTEKLGDDHVIGVCGPLREEDFEPVYRILEKARSEVVSMPRLDQGLRLAEI